MIAVKRGKLRYVDRYCYFVGCCGVVFIASFELFGFEGEDFGPEAVGFEYLLREDGRGRGERGYCGVRGDK